MTLTELRYIVALADAAHFGRAAERCHVSQPTLSIAVKKLEQELEVALFERHRHRVRLTPVGERVVAQARRVLEQAEQVKVEAQSGRDALAAPLRLGAIYTVAPYLFPHLVPQLKQLAPAMPLYLEESYTDTLSGKLERGELDAIVIALPFSQPDVLVRELYDETMVALLPEAHPWSERDSIRASELDQTTLLMLGEGHCFRDQVVEACSGLASAKSTGTQITEGGSLETLRLMVESGLGATVLPRSAIEATPLSPRVRVAEFAKPVPKRTLALAWRAGFPRPAAIDVLIDAIRQCPLNVTQGAG